MSEFVSPLLMRASESAEAKNFVLVRAPCDIVIAEIFIGPILHKLEEARLVKGGYQEMVRLPEGPKPGPEEAVGVIAAILDEKGEPTMKSPITGALVGELEPAALVLSPHATHIVHFQPESPSRRGAVRFKRFDIRHVEGDLTLVDLSDILIETAPMTRQTMLLSRPVPLAIACQEAALKISHPIEPGRSLHIVLSNRGAEPVTLHGGILFEEPDSMRPIVPNLARGTGKGAN